MRDRYKSGRILKPDESHGNHWTVVWGEWNTAAIDRDHAERIIDHIEKARSIGEQKAKAEIRVALGLKPYGDHVQR